MAKHNEIGKIGEDLSCKWLESNNFTVLQQNYSKKYGEIDIVARETDKIHFIEVKTVSYETKDYLEYAVSHETWSISEKVHKDKQSSLKNIIGVWLLENAYEGEWQIDILLVRVVPREKYAQIELLDNVVFE